MASILKVDELQGITAAGDITVTSEGGAATQSLQQGLNKWWANWNGITPVIEDSFNNSSLTDNATGDYTMAYSNSTANKTYCPAGQSHIFDDSGTENTATKVKRSSGDSMLTTSIRVVSINNSASLADRKSVSWLLSGDLA